MKGNNELSIHHRWEIRIISTHCLESIPINSYHREYPQRHKPVSGLRACFGLIAFSLEKQINMLVMNRSKKQREVGHAYPRLFSRLKQMLMRRMRGVVVLPYLP